MRLIIIESPYAGDVERNVEYARRCVRDSLQRGEAPIASHLLYTQRGILNDAIPDERQLGIDAGLAWRRVAEASAVYSDYGVTPGMEYGIKAAFNAGIDVEYRVIGRNKAIKRLHPTIDQLRKIVEATCKARGVYVDEVLSSARRRELSRTRFMAIWLCRRLTVASYPQIAEAVGYKDHTSVSYGMAQAEVLRDRCNLFLATSNQLHKELSEEFMG